MGQETLKELIVAAKKDEVNPYLLTALQPWFIRALDDKRLLVALKGWRKTVASITHPDTAPARGKLSTEAQYAETQLQEYLTILNQTLKELDGDEWYRKKALKDFQTDNVVDNLQNKVSRTMMEMKRQQDRHEHDIRGLEQRLREKDGELQAALAAQQSTDTSRLESKLEAREMDIKELERRNEITRRSLQRMEKYGKELISIYADASRYLRALHAQDQSGVPILSREPIALQWLMIMPNEPHTPYSHSFGRIDPIEHESVRRAQWKNRTANNTREPYSATIQSGQLISSIKREGRPAEQMYLTIIGSLPHYCLDLAAQLCKLAGDRGEMLGQITGVLKREKESVRDKTDEITPLTSDRIYPYTPLLIRQTIKPVSGAQETIYRHHLALPVKIG